MPWKYNGQTIIEGKEFVGVNGQQFTKVWMRLTADERKMLVLLGKIHQQVKQLLIIDFIGADRQMAL